MIARDLDACILQAGSFEDFETMKKKTKGILIGMIAAVAGALVYKATH